MFPCTTLVLEAGSLCFTYCQVPVVYRIGDTHGLTEVFMADGTRRRFSIILLQKLGK